MLSGADKEYDESKVLIPRSPNRSRRSSATDIFFDCVSQYSDLSSDDPLYGSNSVFSGTPDYFFEGRLKFPEEYISVSRLTGVATVIAIAEIASKSKYLQHKYFLIYHVNPRIWRRITVSATIIIATHNSAFSNLASRDTVAWRILPLDLQSRIEDIASSIPLLERVTMISLIIVEDDLGGFSVDVTCSNFTEDIEENQAIDNDTILQDLADVDCPQFAQREVFAWSQVSYAAVVSVNGCESIERKLPFKGSRESGIDTKRKFLDDLKLLHSLRDCKWILDFTGVVLDDTEKQIMSFIYECPALGFVDTCFWDARLTGKKIPWEKRELWIK